MKKRKIVNLGLFLVAVVLVGVFAFSVRIEAAADSVAVLKTSGMTCGSCAGKIEKALRERPGVATVEIEIDTGRVIVAYDSKAAKAEALAESVSGIGYGSSILQVLTAEQYRAVTGSNVAVKGAQGSGCACCDKKK